MWNLANSFVVTSYKVTNLPPKNKNVQKGISTSISFNNTSSKAEVYTIRALSDLILQTEQMLIVLVLFDLVKQLHIKAKTCSDCPLPTQL